MHPSRREFVVGSGAALLAGIAQAARQPPVGGLGIGISSYAIRSRGDREFADPVRFLEFCRQRGAAGVQVPIGARPTEYLRDLRARVEKHRLYLEGSGRLPRDRADVERFAAEVRATKPLSGLSDQI